MSIRKIKERKAAAAKQQMQRKAPSAENRPRNTKMAAMDNRMMEVAARNRGTSPSQVQKARQDNAKNVKQTNDFYQRAFSDKKSPLSQATARAQGKPVAQAKLMKQDNTRKLTKGTTGTRATKKKR